jgi:hypothetical protein
MAFAAETQCEAPPAISLPGVASRHQPGNLPLTPNAQAGRSWSLPPCAQHRHPPQERRPGQAYFRSIRDLSEIYTQIHSGGHAAEMPGQNPGHTRAPCSGLTSIAHGTGPRPYRGVL